jgi:uncharacterized protein with PIN domain
VPKQQRESLSAKFLIDGMLGSLATKLRILGFDAIYDKDSPDAKLIHIAKKQARILITSDQELFLNAKRIHMPAVLITKTNDKARLVELSRHLGIMKLDLSVRPRCSDCNSNLIEMSKRDKFERPIFKCENCGKLYWRGSHWKKLDSLFSEVNEELNYLFAQERIRSLSAKD